MLQCEINLLYFLISSVKLFATDITSSCGDHVMKTLAKFGNAYRHHNISNLLDLSVTISKNIARLFKMPRKR